MRRLEVDRLKQGKAVQGVNGLAAGAAPRALVMALALADAGVVDIRDLHRLTRLAGGLARTVDDADYPQIRVGLLLTDDPRHASPGEQGNPH